MIELANRSRSQRRMLLQSLIGQRVRIAYDHRESKGLEAVVQVVALAVEVTGEPDKVTTLVCRMCDEDDRFAVIPIGQLRALEPLEFYPTDPRHPDYEPEAIVVRPTRRRQ